MLYKQAKREAGIPLNCTEDAGTPAPTVGGQIPAGDPTQVDPTMSRGRDLTYGLDEYGRYVERDGEHLMIEPYPYNSPLRKLAARVDIARWHIGIIRQHGVKHWRELRKL